MGSSRRSDPVFAFLTGGREGYYRVKAPSASLFISITALDRCHLKRHAVISCVVAGEVS